jgi:hypothetical protein
MFAYINGIKIVALTKEQCSIEGLDFQEIVEVPEGQCIMIDDEYSMGVFKSYHTGTESHILTKLAFNQRFTIYELAAIQVAKASDPILTVLQNQLDMAEYINILDPATQQGVGYLTQQGYITPQRMTEILSVI